VSRDEGDVPHDSRIAEYQAAGLYDPAAPNAAERLALLEWLAARGVTIEQMKRSRRPGGALTGLAGDLMMNPGAHLRLAELAARAGLTVDRVEAIRRTAGLAPVDPEEPRFADRDVQSFAAFAVGAQLFGEQATRHFGRVMGSSLARIAEAVVSMFLINIEGPIREAHGTELELAQANLRATEAAEMVPPVLQSVFRAHLEESIRRFRLAREGSIETARFAVGFVDLVGFTTLSRRMSPRELTDTIERFESTAHETATAKGGRVVKLIGDEVMFVAIDAAAACDIALTLVEHFAGDPAVTPRGGLTYGVLINRGGDYYGSVVNLAARLADLAVPNELLVTPELAEKVRSDAFRFEPAGRRLPKGFDEPVSLLTLERP
jgi:class 3 adenylate cyclase